MNAINSELKEWHKTAFSAIRSSRLSLQRMCASGVMALGLCLPSVAQTASNQWEVAGTAGTTGLGFDVGYSVNEHVKVRAGMSHLPELPFYLGLDMLLENGYEEVPLDQMKDQRNKMSSLMYMLKDMTGVESDLEVMVHLKPSMTNFKLLVDWSPFRDKRWHVTTGFYWGPQKVGRAYNYEDETALLLSLNLYNHIYQNVLDEEPIIQVGDAYVEFSPMVNEKILDYGRASFFIGTKKDGSYYHAEPTQDGHVYVNCYTNSFRPYLGFGFAGEIGKTGRCTIGFDAGALFWGGTPRIITHEGVDLAHEMESIKRPTIRHLVDGISALKVYPVLEFRMAWRVF